MNRALIVVSIAVIGVPACGPEKPLPAPPSTPQAPVVSEREAYTRLISERQAEMIRIYRQFAGEFQKIGTDTPDAAGEFKKITTGELYKRRDTLKKDLDDALLEGAKVGALPDATQREEYTVSEKQFNDERMRVIKLIGGTQSRP
jgi:hypothetical protein